MEGIKPCPYCGGELEMVKLNKKHKSDPDMFRIECYRCHRLVARGQGFPNETLTDAEERIRDYHEYMKQVFPTGNRIGQTAQARSRDNLSKFKHKEGC